MERFYITTPIYYVNARPHLGHAYTTILVDAMTRFQRLMGREAFFVTGSDEHGDKIVQAAEKAGLSPKAYADQISGLFSDLWPRLDVDNYRFARTTDPRHVKVVQEVLARVFEAGDIYQDEYGGHYCFGCERFLTEKELVGGLCPDHKTAPEYISEKNYFFRMSKYQGWLLDHIRANPDFIRPERYKNEVVSLLESEALGDLCISRPKSRLTWGIELPFDRDYVTYVWFDALLTYVSALGWPDGEDFAAFWPQANHVIAKDILKPHAVFWPTMLKSAGLDVYKSLNVHGYWLVKDTKMSKSLGNVVEPLDMAGKYGLAAFRYFLLREMSFGSDASFSEEALVSRLNADLANDLGNLFSRVLAMTHKYFGGVIPAPGSPTSADSEMRDMGRTAIENFQVLFARFQYSRAIEALWELVRGLNRFVDSQAPWVLFKAGDMDRLGTVMYTLLEEMRRVALHLWPIMPDTAQTMLSQLAVDFDPAQVDLRVELTGWGALVAGKTVAASSNLFPRVELTPDQAKPAPKAKDSTKTKDSTKAKDAAPAAGQAAVAASAPGPVGPVEPVEFEDFGRLDLRVGLVLEAQYVPKSDRLLLLKVDLGEGEPRQIVAGLAEFHKPEDMRGRRVVVLANLKPKKLKGYESQGMVLAVKGEGTLDLVGVTGEPAPGSRVS